MRRAPGRAERKSGDATRIFRIAVITAFAPFYNANLYRRAARARLTSLQSHARSLYTDHLKMPMFLIRC